MRHGLAALALVVIIVTVTACSGEPASSAPPTPAPTSAQAPTPTLPPAGPVFGSCNIGGLSCSDYSGAPSPLPKDLCGKVGGTWSASPCPTAGVVGTCASVSGGMPIATHSYAPGTAATSKKACDSTPGGVFIAR